MYSSEDEGGGEGRGGQWSGGPHTDKLLSILKFSRLLKQVRQVPQLKSKLESAWHQAQNTGLSPNKAL